MLNFCALSVSWWIFPEYMDQCTRDLDTGFAFKFVTSKVLIQDLHFVASTSVEVRVQPYKQARLQFYH